MRVRSALLLAAALLGPLLGCGSAGSGTSGDAGSRDAPADRGDAGDGAIRTLTTRPLLPTTPNDLLLDPFITSDESWGHFRAVIPATDPDETVGDCPLLSRQILSASPTGVSAPAILVNPAVLSASTGCTSILAPFAGSTEPVHAQIWVSLSDSSGNPVSFPPAAAAGQKTLDGTLTVALLPNALPSGATLPSFPLEPSGPPVTLAGREWGQLALPTAVPIPKGGWFAITLKNPDAALYLAGPQVVPTGSGVGPIRSRPMTGDEEGAVLQYSRQPERHPPRRRGRPRG
jgi:hypothetical protein